MNEAAKVVQHCGQNDLTERLRSARMAAGLAGKRLSPADLAPLDQFHTRGRAATVELAEAAGIERRAAGRQNLGHRPSRARRAEGTDPSAAG